MNIGRRNLSKEMIQTLISLPPKSWSKPSALIVILESFFGQYVDLPEDNNARFQMKMVYDLLKCRIIYENKDKMDEVWINYCDLPICFGWKEFAIVTGLKCYPPSPSQVIPTLTQKKTPCTPKKGKDKLSDRDELVSIVGSSFKNKNLIEALKGKGISKKHKKSLCLADATVEATAEEHNIIVDNPSTASKEEEKAESVSLGEQNSYPFVGFNISDEAPKKLTQLINDYSEWIADGLLKHHAGRIKNWFYLMSQPQTHWNDELEVSRNEECLINIIKGFIISVGLPWHLIDEVYILINCGDEFHWVLAVVILKERRIRVYDSMLRKRRSRPSSEIQKLAKILPTYLDMSGFLEQKVVRPYNSKIPRAVWNPPLTRRRIPQPKCAARVGVFILIRHTTLGQRNIIYLDRQITVSDNELSELMPSSGSHLSSYYAQFYTVLNHEFF
ncbi:hypothetical protein BC332_27890 [Capsicum chinense]|nr:hypothetical protein BC332_27890 [Capsicum chinense]